MVFRQLNNLLNETLTEQRDTIWILLSTAKHLGREVEHTVRQHTPSPTYYNDPALVKKVAKLTTKVAEHARHSLLKIIQTATLSPPPAGPVRPPVLPPPPLAVPKQTGATVTSKKANRPPTKAPTTTNPALPTRQDWTLLMTRNGTPIPDTITGLFLRDEINNALHQALIAEVRYTANHHVELIAIATTISDIHL